MLLQASNQHKTVSQKSFLEMLTVIQGTLYTTLPTVLKVLQKKRDLEIVTSHVSESKLVSIHDE